ncbi:MAG: hypothetical protein WBC05_01610 [Sedimentisphaerales bacterium]
MAKLEPKKKCFIIMPITTPIGLVERYKGDTDHFQHVLGHLFIPALEIAGFEAIPPKSTGSDVIHAEIIKQLSSCELVLCDMSIFNPNVFFEFGIRTALDKPVALVVDEKTTPIPFDTSILNFHTYDSSIELWSIEKQIQELAKHVTDAYTKSQDRNALWKYFGVAQTGTFKPEDAELGEKIDLIMNKLSAIEMEQRKPKAKLLSEILRQRLERERQEETNQRNTEEYRMKLIQLAAAKGDIGTSQKPKVEGDKSQKPDSDNS